MNGFNNFSSESAKYNFLIIEDNPGDFALVEDFLLEQFTAPYLIHAKTHREAKAILANPAVIFDVILLDLSLPDKTGTELIVDIVRDAGNASIIVLTGYSGLNFGVTSLSMGISDYILKDELTAQLLYKSVLYSAERKKAMLALEESEKSYSNLFHFSPEPTWVYSVDTLAIQDVNAAAIKQYGYSKEEFLQMTISDIECKTVGRHNTEAGLFDTTALPVKSEGLVTNHKRKNGEVFQVEVRSNTITHRGAKANITFASDITERVNYVAEIEHQNKRLRDIAWVQSHVVRAPLARLMGLINLFNNHVNTAEEKSEILDYVLTSANEIDVIINDITNKVYSKPLIN